MGLTLAGHLHRHYARFAEADGLGPERVAVDGAGASGCKGRLLAVQAGSATSTRLRGDEPNAYNLIAIDDGCAHVTVRLWTGRAWKDAPED